MSVCRLSPGEDRIRIIAAPRIHHDAKLITFDADYLAIARISKIRVHLLYRPLDY